MPTCVVYGCTSRVNETSKKAGITFHSVPSEPRLKKAWEKVLRRKDWKPTKHSRVCSKHFTANCFRNTKSGNRFLKPDVVPSVFPSYPQHLQPKPKSTRKPPVKRTLFNVSSEDSLECKSVPSDNQVASDTLEPSVCLEPSESLPSCSKYLSSSWSSFIPLLSEETAERESVNFETSEPSVCPELSASLPSSPRNSSNLCSSFLPSPCKETVQCLSGSSESLSSIFCLDNVSPSASKDCYSETPSSLPEQSNINFLIVPGNVPNPLCPSTSSETFINEFEITFPENEVMIVDEVSLPVSSKPVVNIQDCFHDYIIPYSTKPNKKGKKKKVGDKPSFKGLMKSSVCDTPRKTKLKQYLQLKNRKIISLRMKNIRLKKRISSLTNIVESLKEKNFIDSNELEILKAASGPHKEIIERQLNKLQNAKMKRKYGEELRTFALTLHFYSPRGYSYVRKCFNMALPHPKTIFSWYKSIDGLPGFSSEALKVLKSNCDAGKKKIVGSLLVDEISIRKQIETDGKKYFGYVDFGSGSETDLSEIASNAFVIMLVGINTSWKLPLGYFLVTSLSGSQKANIIRQCLRLLNDISIKIVSLTSDGPSSNFAMYNDLGCNFNDLENLKTWFQNPCSDEKIYVFLDSCHMTKLIRNTLGDKKSIYDPSGNFIKWSHIVDLHSLQETLGMRFANKISSQHIAFHKKKMNVRLAVQLLSKSVADSLELLLDSGDENFKDCESTIKFLRTFDSLFDIFNTKNLVQFGFKRPLNERNFEKIEAFLMNTKFYIKSLQCNREGPLILSSGRKTGFLGYLINIESLIALYKSLCCGEQKLLDFLPTYKLSQDHLEIFFGCIRMMGGHNNNPSARQFASAFKKNLVHLELKPGLFGNCLPLEHLTILTSTFKSPEQTINVSANPSISSSWELNSEIEEDVPDFHLDDPSSIFQISESSQVSNMEMFVENILSYISGAVVRSLKKKVKCSTCVSSLVNSDSNDFNLISIKDKGGLIYPSKDVLLITKLAEKVIRATYSSTKMHESLKKYSPEIITNKVMQACAESECFTKIFHHLGKHSLDQEPLFNHKYFLIKAIVLKYVKIRVHFMCKQCVSTSDSNRQIYNKLILFSGK